MQTDRTTEELGINTEPDWESQVQAMLEHNSSLVEQYNNVMRKQEEEEEAYEKDKQKLQKKREDATHQHQVRLTQLHMALLARCTLSCTQCQFKRSHRAF